MATAVKCLDTEQMGKRVDFKMGVYLFIGMAGDFGKDLCAFDLQGSDPRENRGEAFENFQG